MAATAVLAVAVGVPLAVAESPSSDAEAKAAGLAKKVRKLQKQVRALQKQVAAIDQSGGGQGAVGATGPAGPQGPQGSQGVQGVQGTAGSDAQFAGAAAGGSLTGTYPNPTIAPNAIGGVQIVNGSVNNLDVDENSLFNDDSIANNDLADNSVNQGELAAFSVGASELRQILPQGDTTPTLIPGGTAENGSYNVDQSTVSCGVGANLIDGYGTWTDAGTNDELFIQQVVIDHGLDIVTVYGGNDSGNDRHLQAWATCLTP